MKSVRCDVLCCAADWMIRVKLIQKHLPCSVVLYLDIECPRQSQDKKKVCASMAKPGTSTPHDDLFRALLSDRKRAGAFLRDHLPNESAQ